MTGFMHPDYVKSLAEFGNPRELPKCGGWVLERIIPGFAHRDALGSYPLFVCRDWAELPADLLELGDELVSLSIVTDPFGDYEVADLNKNFDIVIPFKDHFIVDLSLPLNQVVTKSHQSTVRRARQDVEVEFCPEPALLLEEWKELFANLVNKHSIAGIKAFSEKAFAKQLSIPGMVMFKAVANGTIVGLDLWYVHKDVAYGHLVAISPLGYKLRASYALKWYLLNYFADKVRWLDLGSGAGIQSDKSDGLTDFKRGWSSGTRPVYFCGKIFKPELYAGIVKAKGVTATNYFPAYRDGEFA